MDRDLTAPERAILDFMLADPKLPCGDVLRAQIDYARVVDGTPPLPTYRHLSVRNRATPADCPDGKVPVDAVVESPSGETTGFILLWTSGGYLSAIEHAWVTDEVPEELPSPDRLRRWDPQGTE